MKLHLEKVMTCISDGCGKFRIPDGILKPFFQQVIMQGIP
jgi:hypothetical protein